VSGIFFPQRIPLGIDGGSASPAVLEKKVLAAAFAPSYAIGEVVLRKIGGIDLTGRALNKTAMKIGAEMVAARDAAVAAYFQQPLPRTHDEPQTPIQLACVSTDGGRMQTRAEGAPRRRPPHQVPPKSPRPPLPSQRPSHPAFTTHRRLKKQARSCTRLRRRRIAMTVGN
jgi:hypothetical protein